MASSGAASAPAATQSPAPSTGVAKPGGGFALEVADGDTSRLVEVELGRFADGWVQVTGDVSEGQTVATA